jgi:hypothetical protein
MLVGTSMPYLCVVFRILALIFDRMMSRLRGVYGTHQANAGSSAMPLAFANSAASQTRLLHTDVIPSNL